MGKDPATCRADGSHSHPGASSVAITSLPSDADGEGKLQGFLTCYEMIAIKLPPMGTGSPCWQLELLCTLPKHPRPLCTPKSTAWQALTPSQGFSREEGKRGRVGYGRAQTLS